MSTTENDPNTQDKQALSSPTSSSSTATSPIDPTSRSNTGANANGKRPINHISNGSDETATLAAMATPPQQPTASTGGKARDLQPQSHERSGYTWTREEDAPGYAWMNKKALDEYHRAWDALVHREVMVKGRYGDPFEMAERERAMANSLVQK